MAIVMARAHHLHIAFTNDLWFDCTCAHGVDSCVCFLLDIDHILELFSKSAF